MRRCVMFLGLIVGLAAPLVLQKELRETASASVAGAICATPFAAVVIPLCQDVGHGPKQDAAIALPDLAKIVEHQVETYEQIMQRLLAQDTPPSLGLKQHQMAIADLSVKVKYSHLLNAAAMSDQLASYGELSRKLISKAARFEARVQYSVGGVIALNEHALQQLGELRTTDSAVNALQLDAVYKGLFSQVEAKLQQDVLLGQEVINGFYELETLLEHFFDNVLHEQGYQEAAQDKLLSTLWSNLGGNTVEKAQFQRNLRLLTLLREQKQQAAGNVGVMVTKLESFLATMEMLRGDATAVTMVNDAMVVSQMKILQGGINSLKTISQSTKDGKKPLDLRVD